MAAAATIGHLRQCIMNAGHYGKERWPHRSPSAIPEIFFIAGAGCFDADIICVTFDAFKFFFQ
ncbi:hypothetical protein [Actimicrobium antarcticum]|uniref:hypothetical protein n=1 Tax=Actimicrobium antarcticum TaxID=1051899 RepID=UPI0031D6644F